MMDGAAHAPSRRTASPSARTRWQEPYTSQARPELIHPSPPCLGASPHHLVHHCIPVFGKPTAPPWASFRIAPSSKSRSRPVTQTRRTPPTPGQNAAVPRAVPPRILAERPPATETVYSRYISITPVTTTSYLKKCNKSAI